MSDWELTYRMWAAGWQVAHTALFAGFRGDGHEGSTHNAESLQVHQCWGKVSHKQSANFGFLFVPQQSLCLCRPSNAEYGSRI